jgi:hypothetical protein
MEYVVSGRSIISFLTLRCLRCLSSSSILGIHASFANDFHDHEIIAASAISCPLALIPVHFQTIQRDVWISVSFDHVSMLLCIWYELKKTGVQSGAEPDELFEDDGEP